MEKDNPKGAILQRDKKTYAIVPRTPAGILSADILDKISAVVKKYNIPVVKITSGQRIALVGLEKDQVDPAWNDLQIDHGEAEALCLHYVQSCPGNSLCKFGVDDSLGLGVELEGMFQGLDFPAKVKFGVSGCPMNCAEGYLRDVGVFAKAKGWTLIVGGNAGGRPRIGDVIAKDISRTQVVEFSRKFLEYYKDNARKKERTCRFIERVGVDTVINALDLP